MTSKYEIFCTVVECGGFTEAARQLNYSQSAVSQAVRTLEQELGVRLISRERHRLTLTKDGKTYLPYIREITAAERRLEQKQAEMRNLDNCVIRLGTFTSVSQTYLPQRIRGFNGRYPGARFSMYQGGYDDIAQWVDTGEADLGFISLDAITPANYKMLYRDRMVAVLPLEHPLAGAEEVTLAQLAREPLLMLDEGKYSAAMQAFQAHGLTPDVRCQVYDDYTILAMVRQGLGNSILYELVTRNFGNQVALVPIREAPQRRVALIWKNWDTLPFAAREFAGFLMAELEGEEET